MSIECVSGKKAYDTQIIAEDVLIELWTKNNYTVGNAPKAVYKCEDCGYFHLTSAGEINRRLAEYIEGPKYKLSKQASRWLDKYKNF